MAQRKRLSLAEIARQEETPPTTSGSDTPLRAVKPQAEDRSEATPASMPETRNRKSDFVKISVTLPPDMHEALQDLSHARRKRKERHMISDIVREALASWLPDQHS